MTQYSKVINQANKLQNNICSYPPLDKYIFIKAYRTKTTKWRDAYKSMSFR